VPPTTIPALAGQLQIFSKQSLHP